MTDTLTPARDLTERRAVASALLAVTVLELLARLTGAAALATATALAMGAVLVVARGRFGLRERYLVGLSAAVALLVALRVPEAGAVLAGALGQAGFLMAFILLLGLLQEAAATSPAIMEFGRYLTRQPPGRRYAALNAGTGMLSVLFNVGVVSFLVPIVQRGIEAATPGDPLNPVRGRGQITAAHRGFAWSVVWSPTALAPLAVMELLPGIDRGAWIAAGLCIFGLVLALGWGEDRWRFRRYRPRRPRIAAPVPWPATLRLVAACGWLLGLALLAARLAGESIVFGVMLACPLMLVGWILVQNGRAGLGESRARFRDILVRNLPASAPVAVTLAASGFIGGSAAALVPGEWLSARLGLLAMPDTALLAGVPVVIALLSLLGLSPIMMAVFFGSLFGGLETLPADPTLLALAISCGWALSMTFSPLATVVLLTARVGGLHPLALTWGWNLAFSALAAALLVPVFWTLLRLG